MKQQYPLSAERFVSDRQTYNFIMKASTALLISIGHRTGMFETLRQISPASASELASDAALDEAHVQLWLNRAVSTNLLIFDDDSERYHLTPAHAACLTGSESSGNIARLAQYVSPFGLAEDQIIAAFRKHSCPLPRAG